MKRIMVLKVLVILLSFMFIRCGGGDGGGSGNDNDGSLNGTWTSTYFTLIISGNNYVCKEYGEADVEGTLTYNASTITFKHGANSGTGGYVLNGNSLTIADVSGLSGSSYRFNRTWTR